MNQEDARLTFTTLAETLEKLGLGWMLDQVRQEITLGKTVAKTLSVMPEDFVGFERKSRQRVRFVSTREYSHQEQLALLIDAMEQTIVGSIEMQSSILSVVDLPAVRFISEEDQSEKHSFTRGDVEQSRSSTELLKTICQELRHEMREDSSDTF